MSSDLDRITRFLNQQHVLTLCAGNGLDMWCANCFYVFDAERMALWLMTEPDTRHGLLMQQNSCVVGTIASLPKTIALIKGVQYRGEIVPLSGEDEAQACARYCQRFPVAKVMKATIWQLSLQEVKMTDNTLGFGKKLYWVRECLN
ncbi:YhbP family protein [Serratia sp. NPDC078593]|uniref:YhbP family protein n=1 Tax=unclassified Serratia (in: enterobacteria) TaxID=2647522 RepID=UPI0037D8FC4F